MQVNRRALLMGGIAAAAGLTMAPRSFAVDIPAPKKEAVLNLCSQLGVVTGKSLDEKLAKMQKWGLRGCGTGWRCRRQREEVSRRHREDRSEVQRHLLGFSQRRPGVGRREEAEEGCRGPEEGPGIGR